MTRLRPDTLFRLGALVGCGIIALPYVTRALAGGPFEALPGTGMDTLSRIAPAAAHLVAAAVPAAIAAIFGAAFWRNTRTDGVRRSRGATIALLLLQVVIALNVSDYFFLIAAQAPFVFAPRGALTWLGGQLAAFAALVGLVALSGDQVAIPEMAGTPAALAVPVTILYLAGWQIFAFSVGNLAASEQRSRRDLQQRARELLATQQMLAGSSRAAERVQISRELHDTIGHSLTVLNVNLELASHLTDGPAADAVTKAQTVARLLLADVREVVHAVADDRTIDLRRALITLTDGAHSPEIHLSLPDNLHVGDPVKAHAVFRCVQEAITNAIRHARARNLWIRVTQGPDGVDVHISDDGRGAAVTTAGHGLHGMRERLEAVDGGLKVHAAPGRGFTLHAWVPAAREPS